MKKYIKNNKLFLGALGIFLVFLIIDIISYKIDYYKQLKFAEELSIKYGKIVTVDKMNVFYLWEDFTRGKMISMFSLFFPLLAIIPGVWNFYNIQKSGFMKNAILRIPYKKYVKKEIIKSWKATLIFPICLLITFIVICFLDNFYLNLQNGIVVSDYTGNKTLIYHILEVMIPIFRFLILNIACINIGHIYSKKCPNIVVTIVASYFTIIVYSLIAEDVVGPFLRNLTGDLFYANGLGLLSISRWGDTGVTLPKLAIYNLLLLIVSLILLYIAYHNKESVIIDAEK